MYEASGENREDAREIQDDRGDALFTLICYL